jgi:hypothetical protein
MGKEKLKKKGFSSTTVFFLSLDFYHFIPSKDNTLGGMESSFTLLHTDFSNK